MAFRAAFDKLVGSRSSKRDMMPAKLVQDSNTIGWTYA